MRNLFFITLLISSFLVSPLLSLAQSDILEELEIEAIAVDLEVPNLDEEYSKFTTVKETFLNEQTSANKKLYDEKAVLVAKLIISEQIDFINRQEEYFYDLLNPATDLSSDWLQFEKAELQGIKNELGSVSDYAGAKSLISDASEVWLVVDQKIKQMRVWIVYSDFISLFNKTRDLHNSVFDAQQNVISNMLEEEKLVWDEWKLVFDTYSEKLTELEEEFEVLKGSFEDVVDWTTLDTEDNLWLEKMAGLENIIASLESLKALQTRAVSDFYQVMDLLVVPMNQELN